MNLMAFQTLANHLQVQMILKVYLWKMMVIGLIFLGYPIIPPQMNQNDAAAALGPEEGRLVRVGNMLQIVPESKTAAATANLTPPMVPTPQASQEEQKTKELLKKLEEQRKRKEEERKKRREARMAEQQKKQLEHEEQYEQEPPENSSSKKSEASGGRILETIEREEDKEARILAEAMTAVPEPESDQEGEEDIQSFSAERRSKSKKKDDIR